MTQYIAGEQQLPRGQIQRDMAQRMSRRRNHAQPAFARQDRQRLAIAQRTCDLHWSQAWVDHHAEEKPQRPLRRIALACSLDGGRVQWMRPNLGSSGRYQVRRAADMVGMLMGEDDARDFLGPSPQ